MGKRQSGPISVDVLWLFVPFLSVYFKCIVKLSKLQGIFTPRKPLYLENERLLTET